MSISPHKKNKLSRTGDGKSLGIAIEQSQMTNDDFIRKADIANGTLYNWLKTPILRDDIKELAAKTLGTSVEAIFGANSNPPATGRQAGKDKDDIQHFNTGDQSDIYKLDESMLVHRAKEKEVVFFGKNPNMRLRPEEYAEAFGDWKGLPIYNQPITASFIATYRDESAHVEPYYYLHDPRFKDCDFGAIITGDSMYPEIRHGDIVLCKEVGDKSFIVYGDIYYITAKNGLETCKYVNGHDSDENKLMLTPRNDSIKPSPINKEMILKLYKLRGLIRGY